MKVRRRLLSISHSYVVGVNRALVRELARASGGGAWEVTAVAPTAFAGARDLRAVALDAGGADGADGAGDDGVGPDTGGHRLEPVPARWTGQVHLFHYGRRLRSLLAAGWDLVHCWEEPYVLAGGQVGWWTPRSVPLVFATFQNLGKWYPPPFNWIERYSMGRSAGWIAFGHTVAQVLGDRPGYRGRPMAVIPPGVDVGRFFPDPAAGRSVRRALGWDEVGGPPVVGFLGRFVPEKGLGLLTRALDRVSGAWRALLVGAGPMEGELRAWAARHGDRVRVCTGVHHEAVPPYLNAMDVLCAPSRTTPRWREQFGRMLIEAFACGVPVVGSDSGEIPYVVADAGVVVPEGDASAWAAALGELLESPARRADLAARGIERARNHYGWPVVARQYLDFFEQIIQGVR